MGPDKVWGERWSNANLPIARRYMEAACRKQSLVCLAADRNSMADLFELLHQVGPYVTVLKTHVDLVEDWSADAWGEFCRTATEYDLLIFEDRKFADIGKISKSQMSGVYDIRNWSDIVTAHLISGPDIIDGLHSSWEDIGRQGGVLLLAQMSSRGNLLTGDYSDSVVRKGVESRGVLGFIGNGSRPQELTKLRSKVGPEKMIWTPGVNLAIGDGELGQRYGDPYQAILSGSDCIIVGSGIHGAKSPMEAAKEYAKISWKALQDR